MVPLSLALASSIALSGCATPGNDPSLSPAENQLRASNARFTQTVGEGAATGAVLGGVAGALLGGHNRLQAAAIGAAAGGALGGGAGYLVARNNAARSHSEADYNTAITEAQKDAVAYQQSAVAAQTIANDCVAAINKLDAQYRSGQITAAQYREKTAHFEADNDYLGKQLTDARDESASLRGQAANNTQTRAAALAAASDIDGARASIVSERDILTRTLALVPPEKPVSQGT